MGVIPAVGFKTNVKDEDFAKEIAQSIQEEFEEVEYDGDNSCLELKRSNGSLNYTILDGHNEYAGMSHDGLVFDYKPLEWPDWDEYSKNGSLMKDIRDFIDEEFEYVGVEKVMPITPMT